MRILEWALIGVLVTILFLPRYRRVGLGAAALLFCAHLWREGGRWQMNTLYFVLFTLITLHLWRPNRPIKWWVSTAFMGLILLALGLGWLFPVVRLAPLTGDFAVGTATFVHESERADPYSADGRSRRLMVQVWYPALPSKAERAPYISHLTEGMGALAQSVGLPSFLFGHLHLIQPHAQMNAPINQAMGPYPLILFVHGLSGVRVQNTLLVEYLASHGYIVVAADHIPASAFTVYPDGEVVTYQSTVLPPRSSADYADGVWALGRVWREDLGEIFGRMVEINGDSRHPLYQQLNLNQLGIVGHSTGGGVAYDFCAQEPHCLGAIGLDPWLGPTSTEVLQGGLKRPAMILRSPHPLSIDNEQRLQQFYRSPSARRYWLLVENSRHFDFTDIGLFSPALDWMKLSGSIDPQQMVALVNDYTLAFFNHHLRGWDGARLYAESADYPEVQFAPP